VRTTTGSAAVVWIGRRRLDGRYNPEVSPVRIRAHAFGGGQPRRDLLLSPDHAVHADGVLIPVRTLINGATVVQERADAVTYYHLELARHDVVYAEGLPAESYLNTDAILDVIQRCGADAVRNGSLGTPSRGRGDEVQLLPPTVG